MKNAKAWLQYILHAAVLIGVIWAGFKTLNGQELAKAFDAFNWWIAPAVCLLGLGSVLIKAWRFSSLLNEVHEIPRHVAMQAYVAGQSMTLLPGGIAARGALLEQVGVKVEESSPAVALSSISDQIGFILCGAVAALWFESARKPVLVFLAVVLAVGVILGFEASRTWLMKAVEIVLGKFKLEEKWRGFVKSMSATLSVRIIVMGVANSLAAFTLLVLGLWLCMWAVGHSLSPASVLLAYAVPTMVGRISALPGGFGLTEAGMVGVLDHLPDVRLDQAAAAVLVFRGATVLFTALVGGIIYWTSWRKTVQNNKAVAI